MNKVYCVVERHNTGNKRETASKSPILTKYMAFSPDELEELLGTMCDFTPIEARNAAEWGHRVGIHNITSFARVGDFGPYYLVIGDSMDIDNEYIWLPKNVARNILAV